MNQRRCLPRSRRRRAGGQPRYVGGLRGAAERNAMRFGRRYDQPPDAAYPVDFDFAVQATDKNYFRARLAAEEGPLGTEDYDILIEAIPVADGGSFLHFRYAYAYGFSARIATSAYLSTTGRDKVGFTPRGVGGARAHCLAAARAGR